MIGIRRRYSKPGTSPGTLLPPEIQRLPKVSLTVIDYSPDHYEEREVKTIEECLPYRGTPSVTWINITGLHDVGLLQKLGEHFGLHPLAMEDVLHTGQRPKLEDYDDHLFIVMRLPHYENTLAVEQISLFVGQDYVISLHEVQDDVFRPIRARLRLGRVRIRSMGSDYLAYALIDSLVDTLFPLLEIYGEEIEELEDSLIDRPAPQLLQRIHGVKRDLLTMRRTIWPQREVIDKLMRQEAGLIHQETKVFLRDCYDHAIQIADIVETYRDLTTGLMDLYLSSLSNRMNEIMKVLTLVATIFIPLTFIAGIYGMNFNPQSSPWNMPELNWYWGYPAALLVMVVISLLMLITFRRKGWF